MPYRNSEEIDAVVGSKSDEFEELVKTARLDPQTDFQNVDLSEVDFGSSDLRAYSFSGSNLDRSDLSNAKLSRECLLGATINGARLPIDFADQGLFDDKYLKVQLDNGLPYWAKQGRGPKVLKQIMENFLYIDFDTQVRLIEKYYNNKSLGIIFPIYTSADPSEQFDLRISGVRPETISLIESLDDSYATVMAELCRYVDLRWNYDVSMTKEALSQYY